jgi:hypothetical protein
MEQCHFEGNSHSASQEIHLSWWKAMFICLHTGPYTEKVEFSPHPQNLSEGAT